MFQKGCVRNSICLLLTLTTFTLSLAGCGGHHANTVDRYMPGDEDKSCSTLLAEISAIDNEIAAKDSKRKERDFWNVIEFIVPFFFMDTQGSYEVEMDALKARQKMLKIYFAEKDCSVIDVKGTQLTGKAEAGF